MRRALLAVAAVVAGIAVGRLTMREAPAPVRAAERPLLPQATAPLPPPLPPPSVKVDNPSAVAAAEAVVDKGLAARVWTDDDTMAFRQAAVELPPPVRTRLMLRIIQAVNQQELRPETGHGLF